jgi:hypothetical protein
MNRAVFTSAIIVALIAAAGGGFIIGRAQRQVADAASMAVATPTAAQTSGAPIYYQDPDGKPFYSLTPIKTKDGRDYRVPAGAVSVSKEASAPAAPMDRKSILPQPQARIVAGARKFDGDGLHPVYEAGQRRCSVKFRPENTARRREVGGGGQASDR